jgi:hypothetical protein
MTYQKNIERYFTGMVVARVVRSDGVVVGSEYFCGYPFETERHKFKRAHKWADELIKVLEKYEAI